MAHANRGSRAVQGGALCYRNITTTFPADAGFLVGPGSRRVPRLAGM